MALISKLTAIGDAVRGLTGGTDAIALTAMADEIAAADPGTAEEPYLARTLAALLDTEGLITCIGRYGLYNQESLAEVYLPALTSVDRYGFDGCTSLADVELPVCETLGRYAFYQCTGLVSASLPVCTALEVAAFYYCTNLESLTLGASGVCSLGSNGIVGTKIASGSGYVYVPEDLVDSYKSATNWSTYADQIVAMEG